MPAPRILFADDEPTIRVTLPMILRKEGFDVTVAATVSEALETISREKFDVLLSDLNIGQPGDGFTIVSAMRRSQPDAVTLIITGYPDFETALQAIRNQVDDYVTKPASIPELVNTIKGKLINRQRTARPLSVKRVHELLREHKDEVLNAWLREVDANEELSTIKLSERQRSDHVPGMIEELAQRLEQNREMTSKVAEEAAIKHGEIRKIQSYEVTDMVIEARLLQTVISRTLQANLLSIDISTLIPDILKLGEGLNSLLEISIRAYQRIKSAA